MQPKYYKLPFRFENFFEKERPGMPLCSEKDSIDQNLELLLTTCPGEHKFNKRFGCGIWNMDFERVISRARWEEQFTNHINDAVIAFEQRLENVEVFLKVDDVLREESSLKTTAIKKQVIVYINGILKSTREACSWYYVLYLGPLSVD